MILCCVCSRLVKILVSLAITAILIALIAVLVLQPWQNERMRTYREAVVVSNGIECANIGVEILRKNGSAADAAIATLFCEGVTCPQSMGLGGGFLSVHYRRATRQITSLDARETAPQATRIDLFTNISSTEGGAAVAVPGELRGYGELYQRYGKLPWADLINPTIQLCNNGHRVSDYLGRVMLTYRTQILQEPSLRDLFVNPDTNDVYSEGDYIKRPALARTLQIIAEEGPDALYNGSLTQNFVDDIRSFGGIITVADMNNYRPVWRQAVSASLNRNETLYSSPLPGSGSILAFILHMLTGWTDNVAPALSWHRIIETFKYAYAQRTGLGDPTNPDYGASILELQSNLQSLDWAEQYRALVDDSKTFNDWLHYGGNFSLQEDHGTAHVCVIAPNGDAVAITSTINYIFGALRVSPSTSILLNNEMDDFAIPGRNSSYGMPPSPSNFLGPDLRPLSSMSPSIVVGPDGDVSIVIGAAGGTKITTQVALIVKQILDGVELASAMDAPRMHHQLMPMEVQYEDGIKQDIIDGLFSREHVLTRLLPASGFAAVTAALRLEDGRLSGASDKRRPGSVAGF